MKFVILLLVITSKIYSKRSNVCDKGGVGDWNRKNIKTRLKKWMEDTIDIRLMNENVHLYSPQTQEFSSYHKDYWNTKEDSRLLTLKEHNNNSGILWQFVAKEMIDGFLYGKEEEVLNEGNITFIYPDFRTGLTGFFRQRELVRGTEVLITGERCRNGVKELEMKTRSEDVIWEKENNFKKIGRLRRNRDPYERKTVYVGKSTVPDSGEGIFARRSIEAGECASYFGGIKTYRNEFLFDNLTLEEYADAASVYFNLGTSIPSKWNPDVDLKIDVPHPYRTIVEYRTTLGHKANHKFSEFNDTNARWHPVKHPFLGDLICLLASRRIQRGEEIFYDYTYNTAHGPGWYVKMYEERKKEVQKQRNARKWQHPWNR